MLYPNEAYLELIPSSDPTPEELLLQLEELLENYAPEEALALLQDRCACGRNKPSSVQ